MKHLASFSQASLLAREEKVLQDAEVVITTQRARIGELRSELERLNAEKAYWSETHMKEMNEVIQENTKLRLQIDKMQADLNALLHTQGSSENLISNLTEALAAAESNLLIKENDIKKYEEIHSKLPQENEHLRNENQRLIVENEQFKRAQENSKDLTGNQFIPDTLQAQAINNNLLKHTKMARDLDFRTEELRLNKMCLLQLESDLIEHQLLVEKQRVEIQRLNTAIEALNREKSLIPPVVMTNRQIDNWNSIQMSEYTSPKQFAEHIVSELTKVLPVKTSNLLDSSLEGDFLNNNCSNIDIVQYRTMEEQRTLISKLLKGLEQLGFARSEAECYKERASDYRWFYSAVISHSVVYKTPKEQSSTSTKVLDQNAPPGFFNLLVRVESGNMSIFQSIDEEVPLFTIKPWKCIVNIYEKDRQFTLTRSSTTSDQEEHHIFYCKTEDEFNRWYYALSYGGFINNSGRYQNNGRNEVSVSNKTIFPISVKWIDVSEDSHTPKITSIDVVDDQIILIQLRKVIKTENMNLNVNDKKRQFMLKNKSSGISEQYILYPVVASNFNVLKDTLLNCKWAELKSDVNFTGSQVTNKVLGIKNSIHPRAKESINLHDVILVKNSQVLLFHTETSKKPFSTIFVDKCRIICDRRKMSILVMNVQEDQEESFYFMFLSIEDFNRSLARLREGGVKDYNKLVDKEMSKQVCVVCKNKMDLYKNYVIDNSAPIVTMTPNDSTCHIDRDRREIVLIHSDSNNKKQKITLDCATSQEFEKWNIALVFGGFLPGLSESCMSKYTFQIRLFGDEENLSNETNEIQTSAKYKDFYTINNCQSIDIFSHPKNKEKNIPLLTIPFKDTDYDSDVKKRLITFYTRRGKPGEVRIILNLQTLTNFDNFNKELIKIDFPMVHENKTSMSKAEYIIAAKYNSVSVYCTVKPKETQNIPTEGMTQIIDDNVTRKFPSSGSITYKVDEYHCVVSRTGRSVSLRRKEDDYDVLSVRCKSLIEYERWERAMSIAGFINNDPPSPPGYLPPITYLFHSLDYDYRKQPLLPDVNNSVAETTNIQTKANAGPPPSSKSIAKTSDQNLSKNINLNNTTQRVSIPTKDTAEKVLDQNITHNQPFPEELIYNKTKENISNTLSKLESINDWEDKPQLGSDCEEFNSSCESNNETYTRKDLNNYLDENHSLDSNINLISNCDDDSDLTTSDLSKQLKNITKDDSLLLSKHPNLVWDLIEEQDRNEGEKEPVYKYKKKKGIFGILVSKIREKV
ncbi:uncharacterized protein CMU_029970 [Cryptosporidium muris RN66]|uniref:PH domain-containing protein n=1 Tax=Cryptosporidium muris (strain RN66) TaxID=441375 RepID=B6AI80_CRYMR|nr:uncharacterized protein CMU_029970 [Cryptosporidium muris RN66]EEA07921.1 hypothetical protein, conserved [Cryptosporidium muris RN66]|eukprot:XP_002142270.1 hypothetical protein [Cryptosporidium muris RN66]